MSGNNDPSERRWQRAIEVVEYVVRQRSEGVVLSDQEVFDQHPDLMPDLKDALAAAQMIDKTFETDLSLVPGQVLSDRYRIVRRLAQGGMGEVYQAEDLKLGQTIALKFLPVEVASDPRHLALLHSEVRLARSISHPNVCRVHDIAQDGVRHFLTMEFIDGETLNTLLRRGAITSKLREEFAYQICLGLAEAHRKGVIHRDLKPSNVMVESRGIVRITDFGLAIEAEDVSPSPRGGTIAYMAPEQFLDEEVTVQSDIYSLGLILCELFGKRSKQLLLSHTLRSSVDANAAEIEIPESVSPMLGNVIRNCLEEDPSLRPLSVSDIMLHLPKKADAETYSSPHTLPRPDVIALRGTGEKYSLKVAIALFAATLLCMCLHASYSDQLRFYSDAKLTKPPSALRALAIQLFDRLGFPRRTGANTAEGMDYVSTTDALYPSTANRSVHYWYRQSSRPLVPNIVNMTRDLATIRIGHERPPLVLPGDARIQFWPDGSFWRYDAIAESEPRQSIDESHRALFALADKEISDYAPSSEVVDNTQQVWRNVRNPEGKQIHIRQNRQQVTSFYLIDPSARDSRGRMVTKSPGSESPSKPNQSRSLGDALGVGFSEAVFWFMIAFALFLMRSNLRRGNCDQRGATRLSAIVATCALLSWAFLATHLPTLRLELRSVRLGVTNAAFWGAATWLLYASLEPITRQTNPDLLVSWIRLLHGRWRDPLVGRDILLGVLLPSAAVPVLGGLDLAVRRQWNLLPRYALPFDELWAFMGGSYVVPQVCFALSASIQVGFVLVTVPVMLSRWIPTWAARLGTVSLVAMFLSINFIWDGPWYIINAVLWAIVFVGVGARWGVLASVTMVFTQQMNLTVPFTANESDWYFLTAMVGMLIVASVAAFGLAVSFPRSSKGAAKTYFKTEQTSG